MTGIIGKKIYCGCGVSYIIKKDMLDTCEFICRNCKFPVYVPTDAETLAIWNNEILKPVEEEE